MEGESEVTTKTSELPDISTAADYFEEGGDESAQTTETTEAADQGTAATESAQDAATEATESAAEGASVGDTDEDPFAGFKDASELSKAYRETRQLTDEQGKKLGDLRGEVDIYRSFLPLLEALAKRPDVAEALRLGKDINLGEAIQQAEEGLVQKDPRYDKLQETTQEQQQLLSNLNNRMQQIQQREVTAYLNNLQARVVDKYKDLNDDNLLTLVTHKVQLAQQARMAQGLDVLQIGSPQFEQLVMDRAREVSQLRQSYIDSYLRERQTANQNADTVVPRGTAGDPASTPPKTLDEATEEFFQSLQS